MQFNIRFPSSHAAHVRKDSVTREPGDRNRNEQAIWPVRHRRLLCLGMIVVCFVSLPGCGPVLKPLGRQALKTIGKPLSWLKRGAGQGLRRLTGTGDDMAKQAAKASASAASKLVATSLRNSVQQARQASDETASVLARLSAHAVYRSGQYLYRLHTQKVAKLDELESELNALDPSTLTQSDIKRMSAAADQITREQAIIAKLAEKIG